MSHLATRPGRLSPGIEAALREAKAERERQAVLSTQQAKREKRATRKAQKRR
jgi:hypothetical protein